jgi:hypothetical protein
LERKRKNPGNQILEFGIWNQSIPGIQESSNKNQINNGKYIYTCRWRLALHG